MRHARSDGFRIKQWLQPSEAVLHSVLIHCLHIHFQQSVIVRKVISTKFAGYLGGQSLGTHHCFETEFLTATVPAHITARVLPVSLQQNMAKQTKPKPKYPNLHS